jgi:hypothetical protein
VNARTPWAGALELPRPDDERGHVARGLDRGKEPADPVVVLPHFAFEPLPLLPEVVALGQLAHLLHGLWGQGVLLNRLEHRLVHLLHADAERVGSVARVPPPGAGVVAVAKAVGTAGRDRRIRSRQGVPSAQIATKC